MRGRVAGIEYRNQDERACLCHLPNHERILSLACYDAVRYQLTLPLFYRYSGVIAVSIAVLCFLRVKKTPIHLAVYRRWRTGVL